MKTENTKPKIKNSRGFSTLEILIAFSILILALTALILVVFGNQSILIDTQVSNEALHKAEALLEGARADSRFDFGLVNPTTTIEVSGSLAYTKKLEVHQVDLFTKEVKSIVSWLGPNDRNLSVTLSTLLTNPQAVAGGDTCSSVLEGNWNDAQITEPIDVGTTSSGNPVTSVYAFNEKLYLTTANTHGHNDDFYIYDLSADPKHPTQIISRDTNGLTPGLNAVTVSKNGANQFAYVGNANDRNFKTCTSGPGCSQLQVIDVTSPSSPSVVASFLLPTSTAPYVLGNVTSSNDQAVGKSIFYKDGYVYLGLTTTSNGPGFHIIDVHDPLHPSWVGSWPSPALGFGSSGAPINAIYVKNNYAYLAHPTGLAGGSSEQLTVLDISNLSSPQRVSSFFDSGGVGGNGKSLGLVGNKLYFGRTATKISGATDSRPEFYILNNANPTSLPAAPLGTLALATAESANGILIRDYLAFLTTTNYFQIWNISNPSNILAVKSFFMPDIVHSGSTGSASGCEGNYIYVGSYRTSNDKGVILVAYPGL
ncbi:MAG: hypothetical protein PHS53_00900 [Candidatus Pacebacteria bacterium]|nr:hypothetical protein [Candidatus Paceibacterota bacterium]MDD5356695.1 hypothetical protein [Candidatus Paceibacterota bacterium]